MADDVFRSGGMSADEVNASLLRSNPSMRPPYASGTRVRQFITQKDTHFVRVHTEGRQVGHWVMRSDDLKGLSPLQIKDKFALPSTPTYVSDVVVSSGTQMRTGTVGFQAGWGNGGGTQYEILGEVVEDMFKNTRRF